MLGKAVFTPLICSTYMGEKIFRELAELEGINVGGHNLNNLRFADDSALVAHTQEGLQDLLIKVVAESKKRDLK